MPISSVGSAAQAAAIVLASDPMFGWVWPSGQPQIGGTAWNDASDNGTGFTVTVTLGSGDCPSGCISQHTWNYSVAREGTVKLVSEQGDEVNNPPIPDSADPAKVTVLLVAGPVCPVQRDPPDPGCAARPVPDTKVVLRDPSGAEVGSASSDADGQVSFSVLGGAYYVEPAAATGLMGQAQSVAFSVPGGQSMTVTLSYDTGIR